MEDASILTLPAPPDQMRPSKGHLIPMGLVNKILLMREPHPVAKLIKERNTDVFYIEWRNKNTGFIGRGESMMIDNSKKHNGVEYWQSHIRDMNVKYPGLHHILVFPYI
tara:strand:- start:482 stop:808 length:327 start_codon:yes stop_codon:yes gene_type:complete